jgi:hypothetical protein
MISVSGVFVSQTSENPLVSDQATNLPRDKGR